MTRDEIDILLKGRQFPVACKHPELIETHISWVILCDDFVYKIKKPVHYSFLNFSTIQNRHHYCQEEIRLNWRLTFNAYLDIVPVIKTNNQIRLGVGKGELIDHAVRMRRLKADRRMDKLAANNEINNEDIDRLAKRIALFHQKASVIKNTKPLAIGEKFNDLALEKEFLHEYLGSTADTIDKAIAISDRFIAKHRQLLADRVERGYVRDVHGDLHTRNVFLLSEPVIFDCIEFNEEFRQIDLLNEIAFMAMDLDAAGRSDLSKLFMEHYCKAFGITLTEDELKLLNYYKMYRANVRAKVNSLRARSAASEAERKTALTECARYLKLMSSYFDLVQ